MPFPVHRIRADLFILLRTTAVLAESVGTIRQTYFCSEIPHGTGISRIFRAALLIQSVTFCTTRLKHSYTLATTVHALWCPDYEGIFGAANSYYIRITVQSVVDELYRTVRSVWGEVHKKVEECLALCYHTSASCLRSVSSTPLLWDSPMLPGRQPV